MLEKLESQMDLSGKLRSVDANTVALRVLNSHFMKDIVGNLGAFTSQGFRCVKCNMRYRRTPLKGSCVRCGGDIVMTVHRGGIVKYLEPALNLVKKYELGSYYENRLKLVREEISSLFPDEEKAEEPPKKKIDLTDFMRG
jgi:DNA polymerase II large subunit